MQVRLKKLEEFCFWKTILILTLLWEYRSSFTCRFESLERRVGGEVCYKSFVLESNRIKNTENSCLIVRIARELIIVKLFHILMVRNILRGSRETRTRLWGDWLCLTLATIRHSCEYVLAMIMFRQLSFVHRRGGRQSDEYRNEWDKHIVDIASVIQVLSLKRYF